MASVNQNLVDEYRSIRESVTYSVRDQTNLESAFSSSPIYNNELNDNERRQYFKENCQDGTVTNGFGMDSFNLDFQEAPNLEDVDTSLKGIGTPYMPNLNSPGVGNGVDPNSVEPYAGNRGTKANAGLQWGAPGSSGLVSPSVTSIEISKQAVEPIGDLIGPITPAGAARISKSYENSQIPE
tara:strand:+ start:3265 stop:3810 length:546 start_codon:yes stop_codon:yes gene_type:complete